MLRSTIATALTTLAAIGLAATTFAAPARPAKSTTPAARWASGQVERFDQAAGTLVLKQGSHEMTFTLAKDARLTEGRKSIAQSDLGAAVGHKARVHYTTEGAQKTAHAVEVTLRAAAKKAPHPTE